MKVLLTGATGFVGRHLAEELKKRDYFVRATVRNVSKKNSLSNDIDEAVEASLEDAASLKKACEGADVVFHVAGLVASARPEAFFEVNTAGTKRLFDAAAETKTVEHFVFISSLAAGGPALDKRPKTEVQKDEPVSSYGQSKKKAEEYLRSQSGKLPVTVIRPPAIYGEYDRGMFEFFKFSRAPIVPMLRAHQKHTKKTYSTVYVKDLCRAIVDAFEYDRARKNSFEKYYVSDPELHSFDEFMETLWKIRPRRGLKIPVPPFVFKALRVLLKSMGGRIPFIDSPLTAEKIDELLPDNWTCSPQKAQTSFGFKIETSFEQSLRQTMQWYEENAWLK